MNNYVNNYKYILNLKLYFVAIILKSLGRDVGLRRAGRGGKGQKINSGTDKSAEKQK